MAYGVHANTMKNIRRPFLELQFTLLTKSIPPIARISTLGTSFVRLGRRFIRLIGNSTPTTTPVPTPVLEQHTALAVAATVAEQVAFMHATLCSPAIST